MCSGQQSEKQKDTAQEIAHANTKADLEIHNKYYGLQEKSLQYPYQY